MTISITSVEAPNTKYFIDKLLSLLSLSVE